MLRQLLINLDTRTGRHFSLKLPAYIREPILKAGAGPYSQSEWSQARASGYRGAGADSRELDTDESYLRRVFSTHACNLHAALRLANTYDFSRHQAVLELGCGEMIQAYVLTRIHPLLRYKATDFDPYVIEKCRALPLLASLEKGVLDVAAIAAADLGGFDLVLCWELLYALDDARLSAIFRAAGEAGVPLLTCTTQLTGPLRSAVRAVKNLNWRPGGFHYDRLAAAGELRQHGWNPSLGYYERLARPHGLGLTRCWSPPVTGSLPERYFYLLFQPLRP